MNDGSCKCIVYFYRNSVRKSVSKDLNVSLVDFEILVKYTFCIHEEDYRKSMLSNVNNCISVISWWSVLLVEETGVAGENHRPVGSHWKSLSHNVVSSTPCHEQGSNSTLVAICTDCIGSCKSNYHTIRTQLCSYNSSFISQKSWFIFYLWRKYNNNHFSGKQLGQRHTKMKQRQNSDRNIGSGWRHTKIMIALLPPNN
jgi:hypothetical protein